MASSAAFAARAEDGLAVVAGGGYLPFAELDKLENTCLHLCRESRLQVARKVRVDKDTPRTLWCRDEDPNANGAGGGDRISDSDSSSRNQRDIPPDTTGLVISSNRAASVEPTRAIPERAKGLSACVLFSSPNSSPGALSRGSSGDWSSTARGLNIYPLNEAIRSTETIGTSDAINISASLTCGGNNVDSREGHRGRTRGADLQANAKIEHGAASQPTATGGSPPTNCSVDEEIACSFVEGGAANLVLTAPGSVPLAATGSLACSRVPPVSVTFIIWVLPATALTARGFRWQDGVKEIEFGDVKSRYPSVNSSETFEVLSFATCFNRPLERGCVPWPSGLKRIRFGANWNLDLHGAQESWPDTVGELSFPSTFDQPLTGDGVGLPRGLREIHLGRNFNQPLVGVEWPPFLRKLTFSYAFDQSLEDARFPTGLREIVLVGVFNHEIGGVIWPKHLEILKFGGCFNQALVPPGAEEDALLARTHALPAGLKHLHLDNSFNQPLSGYELPDGLEILGLGASFDFMSSVRWPSGLREFHFSGSYGRDRGIGGSFFRSTSPIGLSPNLKILDFGALFNVPLTTILLPPTLRVLDVGRAFDHPIGRKDGDTPLLPDGLEELRLGRSFNRSIENTRLPVGLKRLIITSNHFHGFNRDLAGVMWPPGLEELTLGDRFNQSMMGITLPETLLELSFGKAFVKSLQGVALPNGLTRLSFGRYYPFPLLRELKWPRSLRSLHVGHSRFSDRKALARWTAQLPLLAAA